MLCTEDRIPVRVASVEARGDGLRGHAEPLSGLVERDGFAVDGEPPRRPEVIHLLLTRGPAAVTRLVVAVDVDAVQLVLGAWPRTHVGEEVLKRVPSLADRDATTAVEGKLRVRGCSAAVPHIAPTFVLSAAFPTSSVPMSQCRKRHATANRRPSTRIPAEARL